MSNDLIKTHIDDTKVEQEKQTGVDVDTVPVKNLHADEAGAVESDLVVLSQDVDAIYERAIALSLEEVTEILEHAWKEHHDDPNFPSGVRAKIEYFLSGDASTLENYDLLLEEMRIEAGLIRYSSPYPEVRAVVSCVDDIDTPTLTARVWIMGTIWCGLGSFINQFFSLRQPALTFTVNEIQLLTFPFGKFLEWVLPRKAFTIFGRSLTLNPGRFNEKEHMLLTIMANVGIFAPYTLDLVIIQRLPMYYNQEWAKGFGYQIVTSLSIQLIGMGFAGMTRRFLVYPEHCLWPLNLATIALNKSFHDTTNVVANGWRISRMRFFLIAFTAMFIYYWLPGGLFQALSYTNWIIWINPTSVTVSALFGQVYGLGLNPLIPTLDWSQFTGSTFMVLPFFSTANQYMGALISAPVILALWYTNTWNTGYLPLNSNRIYDNTGNLYNVSLILDDKKNLDVEKYQAYSTPYMAAGNLVVYGVFFAAYSATVVHTVLYHRHEIASGFVTAYRSIRAGQNGNLSFKDWHNQQMAKYKEVPELWYLAITLLAIALGCIGLSVYPTNTNVSSIFFGCFLCLVLVIPIGIIYAITGVQITLNVFAEFIGGLVYPENALAMNYFKSYGVQTTINALAWAQDLKLGHYLKLQPRKVFVVQLWGLLISAFISTGILNYQMTSIDRVCEPDQPQHFICNGVNTFFTASVFWGTLGPQRVFGGGGLYPWLLMGFLVGAVLPIPFYIYTLYRPTSWVTRVHLPAMLYGALIWGPYSTLMNLWPGLIVGYISQVFIRRRYLPWWSKYNYVLATAFGAAIPLCGILIFAALSNSDLTPVWWGNNIPFEGCDAEGCVRLQIPDVGYFGAAPGTHAWN